MIPLANARLDPNDETHVLCGRRDTRSTFEGHYICEQKLGPVIKGPFNPGTLGNEGGGVSYFSIREGYTPPFCRVDFASGHTKSSAKSGRQRAARNMAYGARSMQPLDGR